MFSIITVNWNGERFLENYFNSLLNQTYKEFKIYIVDNGSTDNSLEVVSKFSTSMDIDIIRLDENYGFAEANNIGIKRAMRDESVYIITLNNDLILAKDCIERLSNIINKTNNKYDIFQILMLNYFERNIIDAAGIIFDEHFYARQIGYKKDISYLNEVKCEIQGACAGAAAYSKKVLNIIKDKNEDYFDPIFFAYYEDVDLALKFMNLGYNAYLVKDSIVYHVHSGTGINNSSFKTYYLTRNKLLYLKRNLAPSIFKKYKFFYFFNIYLRIIYNIIKFDFKNANAMINGLKDYFLMRDICLLPILFISIGILIRGVPKLHMLKRIALGLTLRI